MTAPTSSPGLAGLLAGVALALGPGLAQTPEPATAGPGPERETLIYGRSGDSLSLDPAAASDGESAKVIDNVFETLLDFSEDPKTPARLVSGLATQWRHSADRMTWTFRLREGVRFHDGTALDAKAVKFSLDRLTDPRHPHAPVRVPYRSTFARIKEVQVLGPQRVQIHLHEPSVILPSNLAMFAASIVSPAAVKASGADFGRKPVGTGPFRFEAWVPGRLTLVANEGWWDGKPGIGKVVFREISSWPERREMLKTGDIHLTDNIDAGDEEWLAATPGIRVKKVRGMNVCYLAMNTAKPPLSDATLRRAIALAIDRDRVLRFGYAGAGVLAKDLLPDNVEGCDKPILPDKDVEAARKIVRDHEWDKKGPVRLWYMTNQRPYLMNPERVASIIRDCLTEIGLQVETTAYEWATYRDKLKAGQHELALMGWTTDNGDPDNFYTPLLSEASIGATNYARLRNDKFETYLAASREEEDPKTRLALFRRMQDLLTRECPLVPLVHTNVVAAMRADVDGFEPHPIKVRLHGVRRRAVKK